MSDSVRPQRRQPIRLLHPWDSPGKNTGVGCHFLSNAWKWKVKVKSFSRLRLLVIPWTVAYQAPPSMGFSRQEYWSGVPLPSPRTSIRADKNKTIIGLILSIENKRGYPSLLLLFYYFRKLKLISTFSSFWNTYKFFEKLDRSFVSFMTRNVFLK